MKICVIGVNTGIGNVLMGEPLARKLRSKYKNCTIDFLVSNKSCKSVLENNPNVNCNCCDFDY